MDIKVHTETLLFFCFLGKATCGMLSFSCMTSPNTASLYHAPSRSRANSGSSSGSQDVAAIQVGSDVWCGECLGGLSKLYPRPHIIVVLLGHEQHGCHQGKELCHDMCHHHQAASTWKAENWTSLIPKLWILHLHAHVSMWLVISDCWFMHAIV